MMQCQMYNVGIYCRLSREDGNEESASISAQKDILTKYVNDQGWNIYDVYQDDGYSGTNFDRPDFKRMINDAEIGKINLIITKDLSRLGRNYIQTGYYTEEYFPSNNIRYIALNDNFDTSKDENDFVPFKNIINEWYAKDISKKIRFTLDSKAKNGETRNTVFPIFGYMYNERYERIPDPDTAPIIKMIFEEYIKSASSVVVANMLRDKHVKLPMYYNAIKYNYNKDKVLNMSEEELTNWLPKTVRAFLVKVEYTGTYITSKSSSKSFKLKKRDYKNPNSYVFENKYEGIVSKELFEKAQVLLKRSRSGSIPYIENMYKGILVCGCCGKPLRLQRSKMKSDKSKYTYRYYCENKKCDAFNSIKLEALNEIIRNELNVLVPAILNDENKFLDLARNMINGKRKPKTAENKSLENMVRRNDEIDSFIQKLFEEHSKGRIPESTYDSMMVKYLKEKKILENEIMRLSKPTKDDSDVDYIKDASSLVQYLKNIDVEDFSQGLIHSLIKQISISEEKHPKYTTVPKTVKITYLLANETIKEYMNNEEHSSNLLPIIS